jgi:hypothetical protein
MVVAPFLCQVEREDIASTISAVVAMALEQFGMFASSGGHVSTPLISIL